MKRKSVRFLLFLLLACFSVTVVSAGNNPGPRPLMGSMSGEAIFDFESVACLPVNGAPYQTISHMAGYVTHLGWADYYSTHCTNLSTLALEGGEATLVAANGDKIWLEYSANVIPPVVVPGTVVYEVTNVVVGGTGRFENASGEFLSLVFVTIEDPYALTAPLGQEFTGSISY